jgi:hypothetical protein
VPLERKISRKITSRRIGEKGFATNAFSMEKFFFE